MKSLRHLVPVAAVGLGALVSNNAAACSWLFDGTLSGYPADGQTGVPIDVVPVVSWWTGDAEGRALSDLVRLTATSGAEVPITVRAISGSQIEIVPGAQLSPRERYTVQISFPKASPPNLTEGQLSFTTGDSPSAFDSSPPRAAISHYTNAQTDGCDPENSCISVMDDALVQWHFVGDDHVRVSQGSFAINMYGEGQGHPWDCIELRQRQANGQLGEPARVCTADALLYDFQAAYSEPGAGPLLHCEQHGLVLDDPGRRVEIHGDAPAPYDTTAPVQAGDAVAPEGFASDSPTLTFGAGHGQADRDAGCSALPGSRAAAPRWPLLALALLAFARRARARLRAR